MGAQDWIEVLTFLFLVSILYWFFFYPMFGWVYDFAVWWAAGWNDAYGLSENIKAHADFVKMVFGAMAYFWIAYAIVWVYLRLLRREAHQQIWWR
jgi:hypothetical protein